MQGIIFAVVMGTLTAIIVHNIRLQILGDRILSLGWESMRVNRERLSHWKDDAKLQEIASRYSDLIEQRNVLIRKRNSLALFGPPIPELEVMPDGKIRQAAPPPT